MAEYSVEITQRLLGIDFCVGDNDQNPYIVSEVIDNQFGGKSGISVGDILISINDVSIEEITASIQFAFKDIQYILYNQKLPFYITLKKPLSTRAHTVNTKIDVEIINTCTEITAVTPITPISGINIPSYNAHSSYSPFSPLLTATTMLNKKETLNCDKSAIASNDTKLDPETDEDSDNSDVLDTAALLETHIFHNLSAITKKYIYFDVATSYNKRVCLLSSTGLEHGGYYEWAIKILKCDVCRQEIGIINKDGIADIDCIKINKNGIAETEKFGARAVYGNELCTNSIYYGSFNSDGLKRCYRDLSNYKNNKIGWSTGDIIQVCLNLVEWRIKFYLNGVQVRKAMSLEKNQTYYPIILFSGNCQFELMKQVHAC